MILHVCSVPTKLKLTYMHICMHTVIFCTLICIYMSYTVYAYIITFTFLRTCSITPIVMHEYIYIYSTLHQIENKYIDSTLHQNDKLSSTMFSQILKYFPHTVNGQQRYRLFNEHILTTKHVTHAYTFISNDKQPTNISCKMQV